MILRNRPVQFFPFFCLALALTWAQTPSDQQASSFVLQPGIVVEKVAANSEAEKAGLVAGDILLRWSRGENHGNIESPLDLFDLQIEQVPRGAVSLQGLRGAEARTWTWTESTNWTAWAAWEGAWGVSARPNFVGVLLSGYQAAQATEESGKHEQAVGLWKAVLEASDQHVPAWLKGWFLLRSAQSLMEAKQWDEAQTTCEQAAQFMAPGKPVAKAQLSLACGDMFDRKKRMEQAEILYRRALSEARESDTRSLTIATILMDLGRLASNHDDLEKADQLAHQALDIQEKLVPDSLTVAATYNSIGTVLQDSSDLDQSELYLERGLTLREKLAPASLALGQSLQALGATFGMRGDLDKAETYLLSTMRLYEKLELNNLVLAGCLVNLSNVADRRGDLAKGEEYLRRALAIQMRLGPHGAGAAASLNNLGLILQERGQLDAAEESFQQSLAIKQELAPGSVNVAYTLGNLGLLNQERGDLVKAEEYTRQSLAIQEKAAPRSINLAIAYLQLGVLALDRNDLSEADVHLRKALAIEETAAPLGIDIADTLTQLGALALKRGDLADAEKNYQRAFEIRKRLDPANYRSAESLMDLAEVASLKQRPEEAAGLFQQGLETFEAQSTRVGGGDEVRAGFRAMYENYYKDYADLLVSRKRSDLGFQVLERSRARTLLEMLSAAHLDIHQGVDPALLRQERSLRTNITAKADLRIEMLGGKHTDEQVAAVDKEIDDLLKKAQEVARRIRAASPGYAALTQPQPMATAEIQKLLDPGTLLLEYSLGKERSYVFAVTADSVVAHELPERTEIERLARNVYNLLTARNQKTQGESTQQRQARWQKSDQNYAELAAQLSKMVLGPVAAEIPGKRLLIVSDGALQYIPFAALPEPAPGSAISAPLIVNHEVVNLPSASVLAVLRQQEKERKPAAKTVAVLADPVFSTHDGRLAAGSAQQPSQTRSGPAMGTVATANAGTTDFAAMHFTANNVLTRSVRDVGLIDLGRLPYTRREAEAIMSLTPAGQGMKALDFDATRAAATSPELSQYRIIHFATHGLLDSQHPELSGLVLSLVDQQGQPQGGFLSLEDIYNLNLPAELVVLSACETGLGKEINGEGLIGLTRGFMYAGANRVVASLWSVNDAATADLMAMFYQGLLRDGLLPAAALRKAQTQMWKRARWKSPYYWAAFQIQGDWK